MEMKIEPLALPGVDTQRPIVIAGPCSAETEEQVLETAQGLASRGVKIFRAGIWKPRTKPGGCRTVIFTIKNVKPLCANCHRMIHRNPIKPITIEELKEIVEPSLI